MIKFLVMDVDGTLTDGKVYMGSDGEAFKAFDIKDGCGLKMILPQHDIIPVIITARKSEILKQRCKELGVEEIHQGVHAKLECLNNILEHYSSDHHSYTLANVAYIGDDILDLQCLIPINEAGGLAGCPANAVRDVKSVCAYVAPHNAGEGAVRDFIEYLIELNENAERHTVSIAQRCVDAIDFILKLTDKDLSIGSHVVNDNFFYNVQEYYTTIEHDKPFESHRRNVDIQMIVRGEEMMQVIDVSHLQEMKPYDEVNDVVLYRPQTLAGGVLLKPGSVMVLHPNDAHRSISYAGNRSKVLKVVGKLALKP